MRVLAAPLDWGLGHATRLLPILRQLDAQGAEIIVGVNLSTKVFLQSQMPHLTFEDLPSYNIIYAPNRFGLWAMLRLVPRILFAMQRERRVVRHLVKKYGIELVISDNRFGFRSAEVPNIFISHQLNIQYPKQYSFFGQLAGMLNSHWLKRFDEVWVPDTTDRLLSGVLSVRKSIKAKPIGILSRFSKGGTYVRPIESSYVLCIVSGPEPLRSQLEGLLRIQAAQTQTQVVIVGGKPQEQSVSQSPYVCYFSHLQDVDLAAYIQHADCVLSRSGYSSLMDYVALGCPRVFLIPTPGQTEQEYLAQRLKTMRICNSCAQSQFSMQKLVQTDWAKWSGFANWQRSAPKNYYDMLSDIIVS